MKNYFKLSAALLFMLVACNKSKLIKDPPEPNILPPITQVGANTFGCKINGKQYVASGSEYIWDGWLSSSYYYPTSVEYWFGTMRLQAYFNGRFFELILDPNIKPDTHNNGFNADLEIYNNNLRYNIINSKPKNLIILRNDNKIKSGTFDFWMVNNSDSTDIVHVTEGRFDLLGRK